MGKFNTDSFRFLDAQHFRVLTAIEMGMKNHELVPLSLVSSIAAIHRGATSRIINDLTRTRLVVYERGKRYDGFRLTTLGYDYLALRALCSRAVVGSIGNQIGVGKESDIYVAGDPALNDVVLKFHRLGRTSFRRIKEKRDYHARRRYASWLYLSRIAALKEFAFLKALAANRFPVPRPIDHCRHTVAMGLVDGPPLSQVSELRDPDALMNRLLALIVRLARYGLIHGDFNEFNVMLLEDESPVLIDFPQMVSIDHPNADFYFQRDVTGVRAFFKRRFGIEPPTAEEDEGPKLAEIERRHNLDVELEASGFTRQMRKDLNKAYDEGNFTAHIDGGDDSSSSTDEEEEDSEMAGDNAGQQLHMDDIDDGDDEEGDGKEEDVGEGGDQQILLPEGRGKSTRFTAWLEDAQCQLLGQLRLDEGGGPAAEEGGGDPTRPFVVEMDEARQAKYQEAIREVEDKKKNLAAAAVHADDCEQREEVKVVELDGHDEESAGAKLGDKKEAAKAPEPSSAVARSVCTSVGTIPAFEIRRRLLQERSHVKKERLRVKGKQSATARERASNRQVIKESVGWDPGEY